MAFDAQTMTNLVGLNDYSALSDGDLLIILAYITCNQAGLTLTQALAGAASSGLAKLSDSDLGLIFTSKKAGV